MDNATGTHQDTIEQWLDLNCEGGQSIDAMLQALRVAGHARDYAESMVRRGVQRRLPIAVPIPATPSRVGNANGFFVDGRSISIAFATSKPNAMVLQNFLTDEECDALIALSKSRLAASHTVNDDTGVDAPHPDRTSAGTYFPRGDSELIGRIEKRIAEVTAIPASHGEGVQVIKYEVGGPYKPHFDYFDQNAIGAQHHLANGGQRVATLIMYLNTVDLGGETDFPNAGLCVAPIKGNALLFSNLNGDGQVDTTTFHAGRPVLRGEKWIMTKWMREREWH